jgi:sodium/proline symporter
VAFVLAMDEKNTVLGLVSYAWGGFGAAFGPVVVMALFSRRTSWQAALSGMLIGTAVLIVWKQLGWDASMYEIVPGAVANLVAILIANVAVKRVDPTVGGEYDEMVSRLR